MDPRISWMVNDLRRDGEIVTADPNYAEAVYRTAAELGMSCISLHQAYVIRCPGTHQEGTMKDRAMLFMLFAAVLFTLGILVGNAATSAVADSAAQIAADLRLP